MHVEIGTVAGSLHYMGFADERGSGPGAGANRNLPVAPRTGDDGWLAAVAELCRDVRRHGAEAIVLSLGVDAASAGPGEAPLQVIVAASTAPTGGSSAGSDQVAAVQEESSYDLPSLGEYVLATLAGGCNSGAAAADQPGSGSWSCHRTAGAVSSRG